MWTNSCHFLKNVNKQLLFFQKVNKQLSFLSKCKQTAVIFQKCKQTADIYGCVCTFRRIFLTVLTYDISVPILKDTDIYRPIPISEKLADIGRYRYRYRYRSNTNIYKLLSFAMLIPNNLLNYVYHFLKKIFQIA